MALHRVCAKSPAMGPVSYINCLYFDCRHCDRITLLARLRCRRTQTVNPSDSLADDTHLAVPRLPGEDFDFMRRRRPGWRRHRGRLLFSAGTAPSSSGKSRLKMLSVFPEAVNPNWANFWTAGPTVLNIDKGGWSSSRWSVLGDCLTEGENINPCFKKEKKTR